MKSFIKLPKCPKFIKLPKLSNTTQCLLFILVIACLIYFLVFNEELNDDIKEALSSSYCNSRDVQIKVRLKTRAGSNTAIIKGLQAAYNGQNITHRNEMNKTIYSHPYPWQATTWKQMDILEDCPKRYINQVKIKLNNGKSIKYQTLEVFVKSGNRIRKKTLSNGTINSYSNDDDAWVVQLPRRIKMRN